VRHASVGGEMLTCVKSVHPGVKSLWEFHQAGDPARVTDRHDGCGAAMRVAPVGILYRSDRLLTTSAMSRHNFSVQAAGPHKPKSWWRRPWLDRRAPSMSTLSAQSVSHCITTVSLHQTSLRSPTTIMTRANSLRSREAGRPINVSITRGPTPTRASPHKHRPYDCRARPRRQNSA
jgi:hypothetical protein